MCACLHNSRKKLHVQLDSDGGSPLRTDEAAASARLEELVRVATLSPRGILIAAVASASLSAACLGEIGLEDGSPPGSGGGNNSANGAAFTPAPSRLRKLTKAQYQNALNDIFEGSVTFAKDAIEDDQEKHGFNSIGASYASISSRGVEQYEAVAFSVSKQVFENDTRKTKVVGCTPAGTTDATCTRAFLQKFGRRVFRRPLTAEELDTWVAIATDAQTKLTSFYEGLEIATTGMLSSPNFLYRVEIGQPDPDHKGWLKYNDYEMATRLSFFLTNSTPDDALLDAADRGELSSAEGVRAAATRLMSSTRAKRALDGFFEELLQLPKLENLARDPALFPAMSTTLASSMSGETLALFEDIVFNRDSDARELFDSNSTFVNAELAKLYGLPSPSGTGFEKVSLPADGIRFGILGQASFLAVNAHVTRSSPTYRGKAIRERFLCEAMPAPPGDVPPLPEGATGDRATARQRLEMHRKVEPCKSCHSRMDPIGLGLENFDAIGAFRTTENDVTIDASGDLDGKPFANPRDLAKLLREDARVAPCFARNLFRHAAGHVEDKGEEPGVANVVKAFASDGYRVKALAVAIVTNDAFRFATPQGEM